MQQVMGDDMAIDKYIEYVQDEKIRIAFLFQIPSHWPSIESVYHACKVDPRIDARVFLIEELSVEKVQMEGAKDFMKEKGIVWWEYDEEKLKLFYPHAAIYQSPYDLSYRNPDAWSLHLKNMGIRVIYIPYGIEIADTWDARAAHFDTFVVRNAWRIYTISEYMKKEYQKYCSNRHAVKAYGSPKFDAYYRKEIEADEIVLKKAAGRKIVLWKMHFPKLIHEGGRVWQVTPYLKEYEKMESELHKYEDLFFVVMPHPMFYSQTINLDLGKRAKQLLDQLETHENVYLDKNADYRKNLYHADAIIIDRSALMVEAAIVNVPVLYMLNSDYNEPLTSPVKSVVDTYRKGKRVEDMLAFLSDLRNHSLPGKADKNDVLKEVLPYRDGKAGERILDDIVKSILSEKAKKIKLVLFGIGHVCKYYVDYLELLHSSQYEITAFSDSDSEKWGKTLYGIPIVPPTELKNILYDYVVITTENYHMQIKEKLIYELYLDEDKILRLDQFYEMEIAENKYFLSAGRGKRCDI